MIKTKKKKAFEKPEKTKRWQFGFRLQFIHLSIAAEAVWKTPFLEVQQPFDSCTQKRASLPFSDLGKTNLPIDALDELSLLPLEVALCTLAGVLGVFYGRWRESLPAVPSWCGGNVSRRSLPSYVILCGEKWPLLYWMEALNQPANTSCCSRVKVHSEKHRSRLRPGTTLWCLARFCLQP